MSAPGSAPKTPPSAPLEFAEYFVAALERGDAAAVRACYAPDARLWHNTDGIEQTVDQNMNVLAWFLNTLKGMRYLIVRREALPDGFLQQHVLEATLPDGAPFRLHACVVVRLKDGVIARLDEYLDSAEAAALRRSGR